MKTKIIALGVLMLFTCGCINKGNHIYIYIVTIISSSKLLLNIVRISDSKRGVKEERKRVGRGSLWKKA